MQRIHHILRTGIAAAATTLVLASATAFAAPTTAPLEPAEPAPIVQKKGKDASKPRPALKHYDVDKKGLAINGYDPVAYFSEYGGKPTKGSKKIKTSYRGVTYRFEQIGRAHV